MGNEGRSAFRRAGPRARYWKTQVEILRDPANRGRGVACHPNRHPTCCFGGELTRRKLCAEPDVSLLDVECREAFHQTIKRLRSNHHAALHKKVHAFILSVLQTSASFLRPARCQVRYAVFYSLFRSAS